MNDTNTVQKKEYVLRRLSESFDQFVVDAAQTGFGHPIAKALLALAVLVLVARITYRFANPSGRGTGTADGTAFGIVWGVVLSLVGFGVYHEASTLVASSGLSTLRMLGAVATVVAGSAILLGALVYGGMNALKSITGPARAPGTADNLARGLAWAAGLLIGTLITWFLVTYYNHDLERMKNPAEVSTSANDLRNTIQWFGFVGGVLVVGTLFNLIMYIRDMRTVRWYWAILLMLFRECVYLLLLCVFLLPAEQTWEETNKQSRVVVLLDITPSLTDPRATDEISTNPGRKVKTRMDVILDFLSDNDVAFLKRLLEKNPVAVYTFGTRLDESPTVVNPGETWTRNDWESLARYDFKPFVLRGLSDEAKDALKKHPDWQEDKPGTVDWAMAWFARRNASEEELQQAFGFTNRADAEQLKKNLDRLDKRIDVARTIALGTNVPDSITAAVNREAPNMVQGIIVFSDGRSNLGSDSSYLELRDRATREKIPVFTVAIGEDRQLSSISTPELQVSDSLPIDEQSKIIVEADGPNMANKEVEVLLDLFKPGNVPPKDQDALEKGDMGAPDETLTAKMTFQPGDPPHGQVEFTIDPAKLKPELTTDSKDAAIKKRVLLEGKWSVRARIAKDPQEAYPYAVHLRTRTDINVVQKKIRILLFGDAPGREFTFLRTMLVREVQDQRATLTTYVQNEAGKNRLLTPEKDEQLLDRFPDRFDISSNKTPANEEDRKLNLNEYDLIIAFDPDWSELTEQQAGDLSRWVTEGGGGFIFVAGTVNSFQIARIELPNGKLAKLLDILPVIPADIVSRAIMTPPRAPRRLKLYPERILGSELLKLDEKTANDPVAGWELFFTDREKYTPDADPKNELHPARGFYSVYPVEKVKDTSAVLAEFIGESDTGEPTPMPWIVTNNPSAPYRSAYLASPEFYRLRAYDPENKTGQEYHERFWFKLVKYMAAKRNIKAPRGRVLVSKEGVSGTPLRVQARILNESAKPYPREGGGAIGPKFKIVQESPTGEKREQGPFDLSPKSSAAGDFDGYYAGQVPLDPKLFPPGDFAYTVVIDVPDSPGETLKGDFRVRKSDPEMDNTRPDYAAMLRMASDFDKDFQAKVQSERAKTELGNKLPKEGGMPRLAFKITDKDMVRQIPDCIGATQTSNRNRGPVHDLWDKAVEFELSRERVQWALGLAILTALGLLVLRVIWALVGHQLPSVLQTIVAVFWVITNVGVLIAGGVLTYFNPDFGLFWVILIGLVGVAVMSFRVMWWVGLLVLGGLALVSIGLFVAVNVTAFEGVKTPIVIGLLLVTMILSIEWTARKILRLA